MTDPDPTKPFSDARASLRETAKWVIGSAGALVVLIASGTTISQVGSLSPEGGRFWWAVVPGLLGLALCALPFQAAIDVLKSEILTLDAFTDAKYGPKRQAFKAVEKLLNTQVTEGSVRRFLANRQALKSTVATGDEAAATKADKALDAIQNDYDKIAETCTTELVRALFNRMVFSLWITGAVAVPSFLLFTWAANPPKEADKPVKPFERVLALNTSSIAVFKSANVPHDCYSPTIRVLVLADRAAGGEAGVLLSPGRGVACPLTRVIMLTDQVRVVE